MLQQATSQDWEKMVDFINNHINPQFAKVLTAEEEREYFCAPEDKDSIEELSHKSKGILIEKDDTSEIVWLIIWREKDEKVAYLSHLYVHPAKQWLWLWSQLLHELERICKDKRYGYLLLETQKKFDWAVNFYRKNNYQILSNENLTTTYFAKFYQRLVPSSIMFFKEL